MGNKDDRMSINIDIGDGMIRCPVCRKWFNYIDKNRMEQHILKKHKIKVTIKKMSYEDIGRVIRYGKKIQKNGK